MDDFDEIVIRNKVQEFYTHRHQLPTINNLLSVLKTDINYPGSREHLRQTLRKLGFAWKRTSDNRKVLIEKSAIIAQRLAFYGRKKELEDKGYNIVYVDETWIDTAYTVNRCWQRQDMPGIQAPCNRGQRLIVVHAGSRSGFVKGAQLIYKASSCTRDYHREMNGQNFKKWQEEMLLPNLPSPCAIVMENASYHSTQTDKCLSSNSRKAELQEWLQRHGISFNDGIVKSKLLELVRLHKPSPTCVIDEIVRRYGHEVLRLPPYHPEFNAIEFIWSQLKSIVRQRNFTFRLDDILKLTKTAFEEIGTERWRNACDHVETVIEKMKTNDNYKGKTVERIIINLTNDDTTDSDDSSTETASMCSTTDTASETE